MHIGVKYALNVSIVKTIENTEANFTWPSFEEYTECVNNDSYVPVNNLLSGIKIYDDTFYLSLPRYRLGTPVTLATIPRESPGLNPLLKPYPSWNFNVKSSDCSTLQSVKSMEIDTKGIMWLIDGVRINQISNNCPPKLVLLDLNDNGRMIHSYDFPDDISSRNGGYLNDIVLDEHSNGDFAYITESSANPGLIVYSRKENRAWKLFDKNTMLHEVGAETITINGEVVFDNIPIDGIALSPKSDPERYVYYSALSGFALYRIPTSILKNYEFYQNNSFVNYIEKVGDKLGQGDGMAFDNKGNLYYSLITAHGIIKWKSRLDFTHYEIVELNERLMNWPDTFGFDNTGSLYSTSSKHVYKITDPSVELNLEPNGIEYYINQLFTDTKSYLYS